MSSIASLVADARARHGRVTLELGCGEFKERRDGIGIDLLPHAAVDVVGDAVEVLREVPPGSVDLIRSRHFLEHLPDPRALLDASRAALREGGTFSATVPHFSNAHFYSDPTHRTFYGLYTMSYLVRSAFLRREVPQYDDPVAFHYANAYYTFKSERPHYVRHYWAQRGRLANYNTWTKEWYEESWCWRVPAYELTYELTAI